MKKYLLFVLTMSLVNCDSEIDDKINDYKNKPKAEDLKGFWQLKGLYKKEATSTVSTSINNGGVAGIGEGEILYLDHEYLRFLNKRSDGSFYSLGDRRFYWFSEHNFIKSIYQRDNEKNFKNIEEFQLPYQFGESKDTLIVQSDKKILYLLKRENIDYTEIKM